MKRLVIYSKLASKSVGELLESSVQKIEVPDDINTENINVYAKQIEEKLIELGTDDKVVEIQLFCPPAIAAIIFNLIEVFPNRHGITITHIA